MLKNKIKFKVWKRLGGDGLSPAGLENGILVNLDKVILFAI